MSRILGYAHRSIRTYNDPTSSVGYMGCVHCNNTSDYSVVFFDQEDGCFHIRGDDRHFLKEGGIVECHYFT